MKKVVAFLAAITSVFVVSLAWEAFADSEAPVSGDFLERPMEEVSSPDVSFEEYPIEGGDALNDLMKSLIRMKTFDNTSYELEGNYEIVKEISGKLEEGGKVNRIRLVALRHEDGVYDRQLLLEIIPPEGDSYIVPLFDNVRGFQTSISVKNFMSREKSEILLTASSGRWGERFLIIAVADKRGEVIFDTHATKIPSVVGRFFDDYRAEILVRDTGERAMIDLSPRKAEYNRRLVYNEVTGVLRSYISVWVAKYSQFEPIDVDHDGIFEIKVLIDLSGAGRADHIACVEATLKNTRDGWKVLDTWISPADDLSKIPLPIRIN